MGDDKLVTLFGSSATPPEPDGNNELEAARVHGYLRLNDVRSVPDDEAQIKEREELQALLTVIASL